MNNSGFIALLLDALQFLGKENLPKVEDMTTKPAGIGSAWGRGPAALNSVGVLEHRFVFSLVLIL